jgi:hypothetical protein
VSWARDKALETVAVIVHDWQQNAHAVIERAIRETIEEAARRVCRCKEEPARPASGHYSDCPAPAILAMLEDHPA